jgi:hypothetical protein
MTAIAYGLSVSRNLPIPPPNFNFAGVDSSCPARGGVTAPRPACINLTDSFFPCPASGHVARLGRISTGMCGKAFALDGDGEAGPVVSATAPEP